MKPQFCALKRIVSDIEESQQAAWVVFFKRLWVGRHASYACERIEALQKWNLHCMGPLRSTYWMQGLNRFFFFFIHLQQKKVTAHQKNVYDLKKNLVKHVIFCWLCVWMYTLGWFWWRYWLLLGRVLGLDHLPLLVFIELSKWWIIGMIK